MKRYSSLLSGILLQMALGGIYAYSTYVPRLTGDWNFSSLQTQTVFGLTIFSFTLSMIVTGKLLKKWGPRPLIMISALLFFMGHFSASLSNGNYIIFLCSYVFMISPAMAFGYVCPVASGVLWFPENRGLVTGLAVAGYGVGGLILANVVELLFKAQYELPAVLQLIAIVWGGIILLCGLFSFTPEGLIQKRKQDSDLRIKDHLKEFSGITVYLFFATLPGLMLIGALKPFGLFNGVDAAVAALAVGALALGNGAGRVSWGILVDKIHPGKAAYVNMSAVFASVLLLYASTLLPALFIPAGFILGFCYGGPLVIGPVQTARVYGAANLSRIYPTAVAFHGSAAALGAPLAGLLFQKSGHYNEVLLIAGVGSLIAIGAYSILMRGSTALD